MSVSVTVFLKYICYSICLLSLLQYLFSVVDSMLRFFELCYLFFNIFRLFSDLEAITSRALSVPGDILKLIENRNYIRNLKENLQAELDERVWTLQNELQVITMI